MKQEQALDAGQALLKQAGIDDTMSIIGGFFPRGRALRQGIGMNIGGIAGDLVGGALGAAADAVGTIGGAKTGAEHGERRTGLPPVVFLGIGQKGIYAFGAGKHGQVPLNYLATLPPTTQIRTRRRITVRVVELIDAKGEKALELEGPPGPYYASKKAINAIQELSARSSRTPETA